MVQPLRSRQRMADAHAPRPWPISSKIIRQWRQPQMHPNMGQHERRRSGKAPLAAKTTAFLLKSSIKSAPCRNITGLPILKEPQHFSNFARLPLRGLWLSHNLHPSRSDFRRSGITAEEESQMRNLGTAVAVVLTVAAPSASAQSVFTLTVGSGGQYAHITDAVAVAKRQRPRELLRRQSGARHLYQ